MVPITFKERVFLIETENMFYLKRLKENITTEPEVL